MKAPIKQKQFRIAKDNGEDVADNFYILFVGSVPGSVGRENLVPGDLKEAQELAQMHGMAASEAWHFCISISPYPFSDKSGNYDTRIGANFGTDHKGNVQYLHLPEGSIFKAMTLRELCEHHGWDYHDLKQATQSIRFCYDL